MSEITPYLCVSDGRAALDWYARVLGATLTGEPYVMDDGRIGHAELSVGGARLMLSDEYPDFDVQAPSPGRGSAVTLHLSVDDVDGLAARVVGSGTTLDRGPETTEHGRLAVFRDPFGHRWFLNQESASR